MSKNKPAVEFCFSEEIFSEVDVEVRVYELNIVIFIIINIIHFPKNACLMDVTSRIHFLGGRVVATKYTLE